jgi:hypothetical protein
MPDTTNRTTLRALKKAFERIASGVRPELAQPIFDVLAAVEYDDETLVAATQNSLLKALQEAARDIIQKELQATQEMKRCLRDAWRENVNGVPREDFNDLRKLMESFIDKRLSRLQDVRDKLVKLLEDRDYLVEGSQPLEECILALQTWKEAIFKDWPSTDNTPAPLNRQAVAEAREAIGRGAKGMRKEDLVWGSNPPAKSG